MISDGNTKKDSQFSCLSKSNRVKTVDGRRRARHSVHQQMLSDLQNAVKNRQTHNGSQLDSRKRSVLIASEEVGKTMDVNYLTTQKDANAIYSD